MSNEIEAINKSVDKYIKLKEVPGVAHEIKIYFEFCLMDNFFCFNIKINL